MSYTSIYIYIPVVLQCRSTSPQFLFSLPALMEAGSVLPTVSLPGRDGEPHVRVRQPGRRARRARGRDAPALRHSAFPAGPQAGDAQLRPGGAPAGLQNRRAHQQG